MAFTTTKVELAKAGVWHEGIFGLLICERLSSPMAWQTNSTSPVVMGGQNVVTNAVAGDQMFFRLAK